MSEPTNEPDGSSGSGTAATQPTAPVFHRFSSKHLEGDTVWVGGIITSIRKSKNVLFLDVRHALGSVQVVAERDKCAHFWDDLRKLQRGARVKIKGVVSRTATGTKSIFLTELPLKASTFIGDTLAETTPDYISVGAVIVTAQARIAAEDYFDEVGFRRIDPRYISASWEVSNGLTPLQVRYPGFGTPVFLAPSPAQQLLAVLTATADDRVYCSATSFTTSYRQPSDGVETGVIMARTLGLTIDELIAHGVNLLALIHRRLPGMELTCPPDSLPQQEWMPPDLNGTTQIADNSIWVHSRDDAGVTPFQIALDRGVVPIEGCIEQQDDGLPIGALICHVERLLPLTQHVSLRTLKHLGPQTRRL